MIVSFLGMDPRKTALNELVGWNLLRLRAKRQWSQEMLAGEAGLYTAHVSRIERAETTASVYAIHRLAEALGVKHSEFFRSKKPGAKQPPKMKAGRKPGVTRA